MHMPQTMTGLATKDVQATVAVKNLATAKSFYERTLGLTPTDSRESGVAGYRCGSGTLLVYESKFAGTNRATSATWIVGSEIDAMVRAFKEKGVTFEHYDLPDMKLDGDVHVAGDMRAAWFKDPDGNILALVSG
jgi:catechol 2,3-dioxygenase-like lactoylglutathione lyase family enzyme